MLEMIECAVVYALLLAGCWLAADSLVVCDGSKDNDDANDGDSGRGNNGIGPEEGPDPGSGWYRPEN